MDIWKLTKIVQLTKSALFKMLHIFLVVHNKDRAFQFTGNPFN